MKKHVALLLFFLFIAVLGMALWKTGDGATAERLSIPSNTWVGVKTTGDGSASQYGSAGLPRFRGWHQASFDLETREVVIFGGSSSTYMSDTWTFNLDERVWHIRRPHPDLSGPCRRDNHNLIYDPLGKVHWLFNGIAYDNLQPGCQRGATWTYDRNKNEWSRVSVSAAGNHRLAPGLAYDSDNGNFFQYGGGAVNLSDLSYVFDISKRAWREIKTSPKPPPRTNIEGGLVYHRDKKVFVLFGGKGQKSFFNDTWIFDPSARSWRHAKPPVAPPARDLHAMIYDEEQKIVVLFGGRGSKGKLNDTWIFDVEKERWTELSNVGNPPAMEHHSAVYEPYHRVMLVVDGARTLVFRYLPQSAQPMPNRPADVNRQRSEPNVEKISSKDQDQPRSVPTPSRSETASVVSSNKQVSAAGAREDADAIRPGKIDVPAGTWIARKLPGFGKGPWGAMKHVRLAFNRISGRIYFLGGDYSGPVGMQSGRNEVYSYSIAGNDWRLEHPYCGSEGSVQPSHPDEVGWVYDSKRKIFWMLPGYMGGDQGVCPDSKLIRGQIMTFDPETRKWEWPKRKNSGGSVGNKKFAQYDAARDQIVRFTQTNSIETEVYDINSDTWSIKRHGAQGYQIGQEYTAMDEENRQIYVIAPKESRLFRYDMDKRTIDAIANLPAKAVNDATIPVWDSINKVLLWPQIVDRGGLITVFAFDPSKKNWTKLPMNQPDGSRVMGVDAVFDPQQNALLVLGGVDRGPNPHIFLYRYAGGDR